MVIEMNIQFGYQGYPLALNQESHKNSFNTDFETIFSFHLKQLLHILKYNIKNEIFLYRLFPHFIPTSIPVNEFTLLLKKYQKECDEIKELFKKYPLKLEIPLGSETMFHHIRKEKVEEGRQLLDCYQIWMNVVEGDILILLSPTDVAIKRTLAYERMVKRIKQYQLNKHNIMLENTDLDSLPELLDLCEKYNTLCYFHLFEWDCKKIEFLFPFLERIIKISSSHSWIPRITFQSAKKVKGKIYENESFDFSVLLTLMEIIQKKQSDFSFLLISDGNDDALFRIIRQIHYQTSLSFVNKTTVFMPNQDI